MGEYAPDDQRKVHNSDDGSWQAQEKQGQPQQGEGARPGDQQQALQAQVGGPRPEYDQYEVNQPGNINLQSEAQSGYGNSRDESGRMEQDAAIGSYGDNDRDREQADAGRSRGES